MKTAPMDQLKNWVQQTHQLNDMQVADVIVALLSALVQQIATGEPSADDAQQIIGLLSDSEPREQINFVPLLDQDLVRRIVERVKSI